MGSFGGHALPGTFFVFFALWWAWQAFKRHYRSTQKNIPYKSSVTFPVDCLPPGRCSGQQWEGILKVFFTSVGLALEVITAYKDGHFVYLGNGQHATIFFFFGLSGIVDILMHHGAPLPYNSDYVIAMLSFMVEDVLFLFHLHGRNELDLTIHTLLIYAIHACVVVCALEMRYRNSLLLTLTRSFVVLLQGTWLWQAGFILYRPLTPWQEGKHEEMMLVTMMFTWHIAVDFIVIMCIGFLVKISTPLCCLQQTAPQTAYSQVSLHEKTTLTIHSDSESDIEFLATKP